MILKQRESGGRGRGRERERQGIQWKAMPWVQSNFNQDTFLCSMNNWPTVWTALSHKNYFFAWILQGLAGRAVCIIGMREKTCVEATSPFDKVTLSGPSQGLQRPWTAQPRRLADFLWKDRIHLHIFILPVTSAYLLAPSSLSLQYPFHLSRSTAPHTCLLVSTGETLATDIVWLYIITLLSTSRTFSPCTFTSRAVHLHPEMCSAWGPVPNKSHSSCVENCLPGGGTA